MKLLVCGSRTWTDQQKVADYLYLLNPSLVICGGARGADLIAEQCARNLEIEVKVFLPDWKNLGKAAGMVRNSRMLEEKPDMVLAFWDGKSRGTFDTITKARALKIPVHVVQD